MSKTVAIDDVTLHMSHPDELPMKWVGQKELMDQILAAPLVRCDEIAWSLAGISMAGWNAILSLVLAILWISACRAGSVGGRL